MKTLLHLDDKLKGWPDSTLNIVLIAIGAFLITSAFVSSPSTKAVILAWVVLP